MEKFCIVKRRKQTVGEPQEGGTVAAPGETPDKKVTILSSYMAAATTRKETVEQGVPAKEGEQVIQITLTPEQCRIARENPSVRQLLGTTIGKVGIDVEEGEEGVIVFNLHLKQVHGAKTLSASDVCEILQVSKSFVGTLVKEDRLKSYKMGRLRRFLLEDVLEYLTRGDEVLELLSLHSRTVGDPPPAGTKEPPAG